MTGPVLVTRSAGGMWPNPANLVAESDGMGYNAGVENAGRSAAWLARLLGVQEVVGSNPAGPT